LLKLLWGNAKRVENRKLAIGDFGISYSCRRKGRKIDWTGWGGEMGGKVKYALGPGAVTPKSGRL